MQTSSGRAASKIGIGSYGIGGRGHRDVAVAEKGEDAKYLDALVYTLDKGVNFTEISLGYGHGEALRVFKQALDKSTVSQEDLFITHSFYPRDLSSINTMHEDAASFYKVMDTDYADSTLVTQTLIMKFGKDAVYSLLHNFLAKGKTRYVSLSNASPDWIRAFKQEFGDKFVAHEGFLSFEIRALQDKGVFETCNELGVQNIIWRPLGRGITLQQQWALLAELAEKYGKTQTQIVLNWICSLGYKPMVFSTNRQHIDENVAATEFTMSADDYRRITEFRPPNFKPLQVDWEGLGIDDDIVGLSKISIST